MPIRTYFPDGSTVMFDSDTVVNGVCLGVFDIPAGTSFSRSFPLLAGATLRATSIYGTTPAYDTADPAAAITISYGPPTISVPALTGINRSIMVWATGTPTISSGDGMQALNAAGTNIALSPQARGLNYIGKASYIGTNASVSTSTDGALGSRIIQIASPTGARPIGVVRMTGGVYVRTPPQFVYAGSGLWNATIQAVASLPVYGSAWPALVDPEVFCFATPSAPGAGPQCAIYDTDGTTLAYDLLAGRILDTTGRVTVPAGTSADDVKSATIPSLSIPGIYGYPAFNGQEGARFSTIDRFLGGYWNLSGTTLSVNAAITDYSDGGISPPANYINRFWSDSVAEIIELAAY